MESLFSLPFYRKVNCDDLCLEFAELFCNTTCNEMLLKILGFFVFAILLVTCLIFQSCCAVCDELNFILILSHLCDLFLFGFCVVFVWLFFFRALSAFFSCSYLGMNNNSKNTKTNFWSSCFTYWLLSSM